MVTSAPFAISRHGTVLASSTTRSEEKTNAQGC